MNRKLARPFFSSLICRLFPSLRKETKTQTQIQQSKEQPPLHILQRPPYTKAEDQFRHAQVQQVFSHIQRDRLKKADSLIGTNTHFWQLGKGQQRIDSIHVLNRNYLRKGEGAKKQDPKTTSLKSVFREKNLQKALKGELRVVPRYNEVKKVQLFKTEIMLNEKIYYETAFPEIKRLQYTLNFEDAPLLPHTLYMATHVYFNHLEGIVRLPHGNRIVDPVAEDNLTILLSYQQAQNHLIANDSVEQINSFLGVLNKKQNPYFLHSFEVSGDERFLIAKFSLDFKEKTFYLLLKDTANNTIHSAVVFAEDYHVIGNYLYFIHQAALYSLSLTDIRASPKHLHSSLLPSKIIPSPQHLFLKEGLFLKRLSGSGLESVLQLQSSEQVWWNEGGLISTLRQRGQSAFFKGEISKKVIFRKLKQSSVVPFQQSDQTTEAGGQLELQGQCCIFSTEQAIVDLHVASDYLVVLVQNSDQLTLQWISLRSFKLYTYPLGQVQASIFSKQNQKNHISLIVNNFMQIRQLRVDLWGKELNFLNSKHGWSQEPFPLFQDSQVVQRGCVLSQNIMVPTRDNHRFSCQMLYRDVKQKQKVVIVLNDSMPDISSPLLFNFTSMGYTVCLPKHRGSFASPALLEQGQAHLKLTCYCDLEDLIHQLSKQFPKLYLVGNGAVSGLDALTVSLKVGDVVDGTVCLQGKYDVLADPDSSKIYGGKQLQEFVRSYSPMYRKVEQKLNPTLLLSGQERRFQVQKSLVHLRKSGVQENLFSAEIEGPTAWYEAFAFIVALQ